MIKVNIVTPDHLIVTMNVKMCLLPGIEGTLGVLEYHEPMIVALQSGEIICYTDFNQDDYINIDNIKKENIKKWLINGGIAKITSDECLISTLECQEVLEIH